MNYEIPSSARNLFRFILTILLVALFSYLLYVENQHLIRNRVINIALELKK